MRYNRIASSTYKRNISASEKRLKEIRPIDYSTSGRTIPRTSGIELDSLAVRLYGTGAEPQWYRIADSNADYIVAYKGDMENVGFLRLPTR